MPLLLAFDPGTNAGWAEVFIGKRTFKIIESGVFYVDPSYEIGDRLDKYFCFLDKEIKETDAKIIVVEAINKVRTFGKNSKNSNDHSWILQWIYGTIKLLAFKHGKEVFEVNPSTLKKVATGDGRAPKSDVQRSMKALFDMKKLLPDEADAIAAAYACYMLTTDQYVLPVKKEKK